MTLSTCFQKALDDVRRQCDLWEGQAETIQWIFMIWCCCWVTRSCPVLCDPNGSVPGFPVLHYPSPRVCSNSCPVSWWCHITISSSISPFSSGPQSFPASGSFPMSQLLASGGQSIGASASTSVPPMNTQDWFPLGFTGLITLCLLRVFSSHSLKTSILQHSAFFIVQLSNLYMTTGKTIALTIYRPLWAKWCLCFLICYLAMSQLFFQGASCSHSPWWERVISYGSESRSS